MGVTGPVAGEGLFERERELAAVQELLDRAGAGNGAVLVVEGAAGIGKSELLAAVSEIALEHRFGLLKARGSEFEAEMAFGVACQLFEPLLRQASTAERRRLLGGVARVGARVLGLEQGEPPVDRFAAIHGLYWLLANRVELGPVAIVIDDLQWVDDPSLAWIGYLARRTRDLPLLVALGVRSGDPGGARGELERLISDDGVERIALGPLSTAGVSAIVHAQLDEHADQQFCAVCAELTGGNPLFVRELLAAARSEGLPARADSVTALELMAPTAVGTSVLTRLARMGPEAVALARAVAVLGVGAEVAAAAGLAELDPATAELTADRLAAAEVFAPLRPLEFFHPLIGAAVREDMAPGARRLAHRRAAELLAHGDGSVARVAAHLLACAPTGDEWVVERLAAAARDAMEHGAPATAVNYLRRALAEPPAAGERGRLLSQLGVAEWRDSQPDAIADLELALEAAADDTATFVATCFQLALAYAVGDRVASAVEVLERALAAVEDRDPVLAITVESAIALVGMLDDGTAPTAFGRAEALGGRLDGFADPPVYLLVMLANHAARDGSAGAARELAERALACDPYPPPADLATSLIGPLTLIEAYDLQERFCEDLLAAARGRGAIQEMIVVCLLRASASANRGALAEADADARWAFERAEGLQRMWAACEVTRVLIERDELDQAQVALEQVPDPRASRSLEVARYLSVCGRLRVAQGRLDEALYDLLECGRRCERLRLPTVAGAPWRSEAAVVHWALGDTGEARRLAREQLEFARAYGRPRNLGVSLRTAGLVEGGDAGLALLREAVQTLEGSEAQLELARALTDHGAALRRAGHRIEARAALERGLDLAHHCGGRRVAALARAELVAAGAKPRRDAITGRDALTAGELRVVRLAADGLTNREIAQALFITTKTASAHLSRAYRKLEITRREQLAQALAASLDERGSAAAPFPQP